MIRINVSHSGSKLFYCFRHNVMLHCFCNIEFSVVADYNRKPQRIASRRHSCYRDSWIILMGGSVACINWLSRVAPVLPPLRFRTLRPAICYILKQSLPCVIRLLWVVRFCRGVMRSFFWHTCTFSGYINQLCTHNNFYCWIGLCLLNLLRFDNLLAQYGKYEVNKIT